MPLDLVLNGRARRIEELAAGVPLTELVRVLAFRSDRIAIERNGAIVTRSQWEQEIVVDGDRLEIVNFVGGGTGSPVPALVL